MEERDPFVEGLRIIFGRRQDLKPARVAVDAGLDNATIRKLLNGQNASPKVSTAEDIAKVMGYPLSVIIALGGHKSADQILDIVEAALGLSDEDQQELGKYLSFLASRKQINRFSEEVSELRSQGRLPPGPPDATEAEPPRRTSRK